MLRRYAMLFLHIPLYTIVFLRLNWSFLPPLTQHTLTHTHQTLEEKFGSRWEALLENICIPVGCFCGLPADSSCLCTEWYEIPFTSWDVPCVLEDTGRRMLKGAFFCCFRRFDYGFWQWMFIFLIKKKLYISHIEVYCSPLSLISQNAWISSVIY